MRNLRILVCLLLVVGLVAPISFADAATVVSSIARQRQQQLKTNIKKHKLNAQESSSITAYFLYLSDANRQLAKRVERAGGPSLLYRYVNGTDDPSETTNPSDLVVPDKITKAEFFANAPLGPMYFQANWWCSAAALNLYYTKSDLINQKMGVFAGDCTNRNAPIVGTWYPQRLGIFNPSLPPHFTLDNIDAYENVLVRQTTSDPNACDVDYYKSFGHRNVYGMQFTCDDGFFIGATKNDFQFTVFVFPEHWPDSADVEAVLKRHTNDDDKDGLINTLERRIGTYINDKDTDNDGVSDGNEYYAFETSPLVQDTDADGRSDKFEIERKQNPIGPGAASTDQLARWARLKNATKPVITSTVLSQANGIASVYWTTNVMANGKVNYGLTTAYGNLVTDFSFAKAHTLSFPVQSGQTYHYVVSVCSTAPNPTCIDGPDRTFVAE